MNQDIEEPQMPPRPSVGTHPLLVVCLFGAMMAGLAYAGSSASRKVSEPTASAFLGAAK